MSNQTRPYQMTRRAEFEEQTTRRRITESTVALQEELSSVRKLLPSVWQETPRLLAAILASLKTLTWTLCS